jgi:mono/diheme cytochrome c family protein
VKGVAASAAVALCIAAACAREEAAGDAPSLPPTPTALARGESLYVAGCSRCHGIAGSGTAQGPPLAHIVYEPSHHGDAAFQMAVRNGVRAHHWRFGDMPPQPGVPPAAVEEIVAYVRWVQRERGIE